MRIGPVDRKPVDLLEHPVGKNAVQIKRYDDQLVARERTRLVEQPAFRIELAVRTHRAMQREINGIDLIDPGSDMLHDLGRELLPARRRQKSRAARARRDRRNDFDVGPPVEHGERSADRLIVSALLVDFVTAQNVEILVAGGKRIERGNLLHAFDDQYFWHCHTLESGRLLSAARWSPLPGPHHRIESATGSKPRSRMRSCAAIASSDDVASKFENGALA